MIFRNICVRTQNTSMFLVICAKNPAFEDQIHNGEYLRTNMINLSFVLISGNYISKCANNPAGKTDNFHFKIKISNGRKNSSFACAEISK